MNKMVMCLSFLLSLLALAACAGLEAVPPSGQEVSVLKDVHTLKELRDMHVVKQKTDYSCGAAALATLLTYYYEDPTSERQILDLLVEGLGKKQRVIRRLLGFSLLDLKRVAAKKGYRSAGFELKFNQLLRLQAPVIVFISPFGYPHFAVLRDIVGNRVFLADPSRGNLRMSIWRFLNEWNDIIFVLGKSGEENLVTYPMAVDLKGQDQPAAVDLDRLSNTGARIKDFSVRTHVPIR